MSILLNELAQATANQNQAPGSTKGKRPPAEFWVNIGIQVGDKFIKLPFNLALDDMNKLDMRGNNQDWLQEAQVRNALLDILKRQAGALDAGGSEIVPELQVQLFRRSADAAPDVAENPLMAALMSQFGGK